MQSIEERGATMLEFALVSIVVFMLLGAIFDIGLSLHHRSYLQHVASDAARRISACAAVTADCSTYRECARRDLDTNGTATTTLSSAFASGRSVQWDFNFQLGDNSRTLVVSGVMPLDCFFICRFFDAGSQLSASAQTTVDGALNGTCSGHFP